MDKYIIVTTLCNEKEIKKIHDYKVAEISYYKINSINKDFLDWIDKETK